MASITRAEFTKAWDKLFHDTLLSVYVTANTMELNQSDVNISANQCFCSDITKADYSMTYAWFNFVVVIILLPAVSTFGVFSNVINVFLYSRPSLVNSANTYLAALATSDFFVVVTGLFIFWIDSARSYLHSLKYAPYTIVFTLPVGYMAQTCSVYFTVAAAIDCYVAQCWSVLLPNYNTVRRAKQVVACVVVVSVLYNSLRFGQFNLRACIPEDQNSTIIEICPTALFFKINLIYNVYMYMVLMTFLPFLLLSILNALIVTRVQAKARNQSPSDVGSDDTVTMVMVVIMFLCCNILALVINIVETFFEPSALLLNYMTDGSNFLVIFNSSVNFVIYMVFSREFYRMFCHYFRCHLRSATKSSRSTNGMYSSVESNDVNLRQMTSFDTSLITSKAPDSQLLVNKEVKPDSLEPEVPPPTYSAAVSPDLGARDGPWVAIDSCNKTSVYVRPIYSTSTTV